MKNVTTRWTPFSLEDVYKVTNNIKLWPRLFDNYTKVEILEITTTYVKFKLFIAVCKIKLEK